MIKTKTWVVLITILFLLALGLTFFFLKGGAPARYANIYVDGVCVESIDLDAVGESFTRLIEFADGESNLLQIEPGRIRIQEATCPDKVCVNTGWITSEGLPIVCLPHKLVIQLEQNSKAG